MNANRLWSDALNKTPNRVGPEIGRPPKDPVVHFREWPEGDGAPFWPNVRSGWAIRSLPNVLTAHFADLKADMPGEIRRIAAVLDLESSDWDRVLDHCTFDPMKTSAPACAPLGAAFWEGGVQTFIHKGVNGAGRVFCPRVCHSSTRRRPRPSWVRTAPRG